MKTPCDRKDIYLPEPATVLRNEPMTATENFFEFQLESGRPLGHKPGQFVEVSVPGIGEAPISISSAENGSAAFQMVVRRIGNVSGDIQHDCRTGFQFFGKFGERFLVEVDQDQPCPLFGKKPGSGLTDA